MLSKCWRLGSKYGRLLPKYGNWLSKCGRLLSKYGRLLSKYGRLFLSKRRLDERLYYITLKEGRDYPVVFFFDLRGRGGEGMNCGISWGCILPAAAIQASLIELIRSG